MAFVPTTSAVQHEVELPCRRGALACKALFYDCVTAVPEVTGSEWLEFRQVEFNLWNRTMKATAQGKSSLDYRLRNHPELREVVCNLLNGLAREMKGLRENVYSRSSLSEALAMSHSEMDTDSDDGSSSDISILTHGENTYSLSSSNVTSADIKIRMVFIETTISQLARLSTKIRQSGSRYRNSRADDTLKEEDYAAYMEFWTNNILSRRLRLEEPGATSTDQESSERPLTPIQQRLLRANLLRLNRIMFTRGSMNPLEDSVEVTAAMDGVGDQNTTSSICEDGAGPAASVLNTATAVGSQIDIPEVLKCSEPSIATRATRIGSNGSLEYPKCPKPPTDGASITCPYCADILPSDYYKKPLIWRKHVARDILPYMCFYEDCSTPHRMYSSSEELLQHRDESHTRKMWICPWCSPTPGSKQLVHFGQRGDWECHVRGEHQAFVVQSEIPLLADVCEKKAPQPVSCPLCLKDSSETVPSDDDHILWHTHSFALGCLPWDNDYLESESESESTSERPHTIEESTWLGEITTEKFELAPIREHSAEIEGIASVSGSREGAQELTSDKALSEAPVQRDIYEFLRQEARCSKPEPFPTFFDDAVYFQDCDGGDYTSQPPSPTIPTSSTALSTSSSSSISRATSSYGSTSLSMSVSDRDENDSLRLLDIPRPTKLDIAGHVKPFRSWVIRDVATANSVRDAGACIRCRLQRVSCTTSGICQTCIKTYPKAPDICCNRKDFATVALEYSSRRFAGLTHKNDDIVKEMLHSARPEFGPLVFEGQIFLDRSCTGVPLPACLRNYTCKTVGTDIITHVGCTFSRTHFNSALSQDHQLQWTEQSLSPEDFSTFEGGIESLIRTYVRLGSARQRPQCSLLEKVHIFKSAYKICRAHTLFFVQTNDKGVDELPQPAQAELRDVARAALESSERDILGELDKYLKTPKIAQQERPAIWAALWQLILIYRDLLRNVRPWHNNADALFNAVAVFYATLFRTTAALKSLNEVNSAWLLNDPQRHDLVGALNYALSLRDNFYQSIVASVNFMDERLRFLVVEPEMKVLNRRVRKKPTSDKDGAPHDHDGDTVMDGC